MESKGSKDRKETNSRRGKREAAERLIALVGELGNVSEACRRLAVDRSSYYRIIRATQDGRTPWEEGGNRRRNSLPEATGPAILGLCLQYPEWGCDRIAHYLTLTGRPVSSPTVQKHLIRNGLGRVAQRMEASRARTAGTDGGSPPGGKAGSA